MLLSYVGTVVSAVVKSKDSCAVKVPLSGCRPVVSALCSMGAFACDKLSLNWPSPYGVRKFGSVAAEGSRLDTNESLTPAVRVKVWSKVGAVMTGCGDWSLLYAHMQRSPLLQLHAAMAQRQ